MSNYNSLKTTIDANIKQNGNQEITGQILNSVLNQMVNILGTGYQFAGVATIDTNPGAPDAKVFYIANGKGTYTNFGGIEVTEDDVVVLYWDSAWHKVSTGIASQEKLTELGSEVVSSSLCPLEGYFGRYFNENSGIKEVTKFQVEKGYTYQLYLTISEPTPAGAAYLFGIYDEDGNTIEQTIIQPNSTSFVSNKFSVNERKTLLLKSELELAFDWSVRIVEIERLSEIEGNISELFSKVPQTIKIYGVAAYEDIDLNTLHKGAKIINRGVPIIVANDSQFNGRINIPTNGIIYLDSEKKHIQVGSVAGDVDFDYILNPSFEDYNELSDEIKANQLDVISSVIYSGNRYVGTSKGIPSGLQEVSRFYLYPEQKYRLNVKAKNITPAGIVYINELFDIDGNSIAKANMQSNTTEISSPDFSVSEKTLAIFKSEVRKDFEWSIESSSDVTSSLNITLPSRIIAVVGDKLQIFFHNLLDISNPNIYDITAICSKGKSYPRYWDFTPTNEDIGKDYSLQIKVRNKANSVIALKETTISVVNKMTSPDYNKNVLCVGDSLTSGGQWVAELKRRLVETSGNNTPFSPTGLGLNNISFVGRKFKSNVNFEATGGWKVVSYGSKGERAYRLEVVNVRQLNIGDTYTSSNGGVFVLQEINVTEGVGNVRFTFNSAVPTIPLSGTLTRTSGSGDTTIQYTSYVDEYFSPFFNVDTNKLDFKTYANDWCDGDINTMIWLCGTNDIFSGTDESIDSAISTYRNIISQYHIDFPNGKIILCSVPIGSLNGGFGANYGSSNIGNALTFKSQAQKYATELESLANEYSSFVFLCPVLEEFDSEYNYPVADTPVNNRSEQVEKIGTNAVHPNTGGYYQIADAIYRIVNRYGL